MSTMLDQYIQRFQNMPSWNIHSITPDGMAAVPWMEVLGEEIAAELIFDELNPMPQVDTIAADIQKWGRLESLATRVWQMGAREVTIWKAQFMVDVYEAEEKTPAKHFIEAQYRTHKDYRRLNIESERAEEAASATSAVLLAFRAKKDILERFARKYRDG